MIFLPLVINLIAVVFAAILLRSPKTVKEKYTDILIRKKVAFLMHFLPLDSLSPMAPE